MKYFINISILIILTLMLTHTQAEETTFYSRYEQPYMRIIANLTTNAELHEFFEVQCAIYVDNVYGAYERFFHRLLSELPRCKRAQQLRELLREMEVFLDMDDSFSKMLQFNEFLMKQQSAFENLFEYDLVETQLTSAEFNDLYVRNEIEELIHYANENQLRRFVGMTGRGIRMFLMLNRRRLSKSQLLEFKEIVDRFLEDETFADKRKSLMLFLEKCEDCLNEWRLAMEEE